MSTLHATLYPVVLLTANTVTAFGAYLLTGPPIALLLGAVTLLLFVGIVKSQYHEHRAGLLGTVR